MTTLFPSSTSSELEPYVVPFGRMMLAYGRAQEMIVAFVLLELGDESRARELVRGTHDLPKKLRRLFRNKYDLSLFDEMNRIVRRFSDAAGERHHLVHGEWWFDFLETNNLFVRHFNQGIAVHKSDVTPEVIVNWAIIFDETANQLEEVYSRILRVQEAAAVENLLLQEP